LAKKKYWPLTTSASKIATSQTWFLYGGIMVAISSLISALIPKLGRKRRHDGWL
jgi:hypothetical protein